MVIQLLGARLGHESTGARLGHESTGARLGHESTQPPSLDLIEVKGFINSGSGNFHWDSQVMCHLRMGSLLTITFL